MVNDTFYKSMGVSLLIISLLALGSIIYFISYAVSVTEIIKSNADKFSPDMKSNLDKVSFGFNQYFIIFSLGGGWSFLIILFSGIIYLFWGVKKRLANKLIFSSAVIQIVAIFIMLLGLLTVVSCFGGAKLGPFTPLCGLAVGLSAIFSTLISISGGALLIIGILKTKNQTNALVKSNSSSKIV